MARRRDSKEVVDKVTADIFAAGTCNLREQEVFGSLIYLLPTRSEQCSCDKSDPKSNCFAPPIPHHGDRDNVPSVLRSLCDFLLTNGLRVDNLFSRPVDVTVLQNARDALSQGKLNLEPKDTILAAHLLKDFLAQLPQPVIPFEFYRGCLEIAENHLNHCAEELRQDTRFARLLPRYILPNQVWERLWRKTRKRPTGGTALRLEVCAEAVDKYATGVWHFIDPMDNWCSRDLTPRQKSTLKYIAGFLCDFSARSDADRSGLRSLSEIFSYLLLRPSFESTDHEENAWAGFLKAKFLYLFLQMTKKSKRLMTKVEEQQALVPLAEIRRGIVKRANLKIAEAETGRLSSDSSASVKRIDLDLELTYAISLPVATASSPEYLMDFSEQNNIGLKRESGSLQKDKGQRLSRGSELTESTRISSQHFVHELYSEQELVIDPFSQFLVTCPHLDNWLCDHTEDIPAAFKDRVGDVSSSCDSSVLIRLTQNETEQVPPGQGLLSLHNEINNYNMLSGSMTHSTVSSPHTSWGSIPDILMDPAMLYTDGRNLNLKLPTFKKRDECRQCDYKFQGLSLGRSRKFCNYCTQTYCSKCLTKEFFIPSFMTQRGDFGQHDTCDGCEQYLSKNRNAPLIQFAKIQQPAMRTIGKSKFSELTKLRNKLCHYIYDIILPDCPSRFFLLGLIEPHYHYLLHREKPLVSIMDLIEMKTSRYCESLANVLKLFVKHVSVCSTCTYLRDSDKIQASHMLQL